MKVKLWISLVLAFLAFIFITQNTETVNVRFLAWSVEMSIVLLVFIMLGSGVMIGWLLNSYSRYSMKKSKERLVEERGTEETERPVQDATAIKQEERKLDPNEMKEKDE